MASSPELQHELESKTINLLEKWEKIKLLTGLIGADSLKETALRQARNLEAEDAAVRSAMGWRCDKTDPSTANSEMHGHTILGDVQYPAPIVINGQQKSGLGPVVAALLGMAIPGAGLGGYIASQMLAHAAPTVEKTIDTDSTVELGLSRLSDVIPPE